jgi:hypothetical protein
MFRKITSKNDDGNTNVFTEFKKEFGWVADSFVKKKDILIASYPKQIFIGMIAILIISFVLRFTILSSDHKKDQKNAAVLGPAISAMTKPTQQMNLKIKILDSATTLRAHIQTVMFKDIMTKEDSIFIIKSNRKLKQMENEINQL